MTALCANGDLLALYLLVVVLAAAMLSACAARAPDGSVTMDVGTTVRALGCVNADMSDAAMRKRCHVEVGR